MGDKLNNIVSYVRVNDAHGPNLEEAGDDVVFWVFSNSLYNVMTRKMGAGEVGRAHWSARGLEGTVASRYSNDFKISMTTRDQFRKHVLNNWETVQKQFSVEIEEALKSMNDDNIPIFNDLIEQKFLEPAAAADEQKAAGAGADAEGEAATAADAAAKKAEEEVAAKAAAAKEEVWNLKQIFLKHRDARRWLMKMAGGEGSSKEYFEQLLEKYNNFNQQLNQWTSARPNHQEKAENLLDEDILYWALSSMLAEEERNWKNLQGMKAAAEKGDLIHLVDRREALKTPAYEDAKEWFIRAVKSAALGQRRETKNEKKEWGEWEKQVRRRRSRSGGGRRKKSRHKTKRRKTKRRHKTKRKSKQRKSKRRRKRKTRRC